MLNVLPKLQFSPMVLHCNAVCVYAAVRNLRCYNTTCLEYSTGVLSVGIVLSVGMASSIGMVLSLALHYLLAWQYLLLWHYLFI